MGAVYAPARLAAWTMNRMGGKETKAALREVCRTHPDKVEFYLAATPVSPHGLANIEQAVQLGIDEIVVRSADQRKIIGHIVPRRRADGSIEVVVR